MTNKISTFYCPSCSNRAEVIQVDDVQDDEKTVTWKRVHLECRHSCPLLWSCIDIPAECYGGVLRNRQEVVQVDNRDPGATWLWLSLSDFVEIDPVDLVENMIENCRQWIIEEAGVDAIDLERALKVLKRASGR